MLLDFLVEFVKPHFELTERLVAALWRKASGWRVECTIKSETVAIFFETKMLQRAMQEYNVYICYKYIYICIYIEI